MCEDNNDDEIILEDDQFKIDLKTLTQIATHRNIYLFGPINQLSVLNAIMQIHACEALNDKEDIVMYINSEGGFIIDCFALIDTMDACSCDIRTVVLGTASSAACLIASNGTRGKRYAGKYSEFMYHEGYADLHDVNRTDMDYHIKEFNRIQKRLNEIFRRNTRKSVSEIKKHFLQKRLDRYMNAREALDFGIVDHLIVSRRRHRKGV